MSFGLLARALGPELLRGMGLGSAGALAGRAGIAGLDVHDISQQNVALQGLKAEGAKSVTADDVSKRFDNDNALLKAAQKAGFEGDDAQQGAEFMASAESMKNLEDHRNEVSAGFAELAKDTPHGS